MQEHYYSLNRWANQTYGYKIYKLALDGKMTCPNRDGTLDTRGCIFCSEQGSGDFSAKASSIKEQLAEAKAKIQQKTNASHFIAYFQSFTNTYAPVSYLRQIYMQAIEDEQVEILSIATRPDCLSEEVMELLSEINQKKPVWVELGLQTIHESTANYIRRGYPLSVYDEAIEKLKKANIAVITHMIVGLPGERKEDIIETAKYIASTKTFGIKIQLLHILEGTDLCVDYEKGRFQALELEEYLEVLFSILEVLPPDMVVHRITGDGPKKILRAPLWSGNKRMVLNTIHHKMKVRNLKQGSHYKRD
jgi:hypothetical protein